MPSCPNRVPWIAMDWLLSRTLVWIYTGICIMNIYRTALHAYHSGQHGLCMYGAKPAWNLGLWLWLYKVKIYLNITMQSDSNHFSAWTRQSSWMIWTRGRWTALSLATHWMWGVCWEESLSRMVALSKLRLVLERLTLLINVIPGNFYTMVWTGEHERYTGGRRIRVSKNLPFCPY